MAKTVEDPGAALSLLADPSRRRLLVALLRRTEPGQTDHHPLGQLVGESETQQVEIRLYHVHLPKLSKRGVVEWDRESNTVAPGRRFEAIRPLLELFEDNPEAFPGEWP